ncbi:PAS domain S-box protein [Chromobacterium vaccinii]|uniref:PAS domain-containing protein n=1 Tax=Chromobacterium vaccinii TaxID=1108595 RepID=UPI0009E27770|nr:PAS domain S-box protein [Chromobacterium vaccinii]
MHATLPKVIHAMKKSSNGVKRRAAQRKSAEAMVEGLFFDGPGTEPAGMLMHELLIHKIELEAQLIELQNNNAFVEQIRDQYVDFYETASAGLITVDARGMITEANKTAIESLGISKEKVVGALFSRFVASGDHTRWSLFFERALYDKENNGESIILALNVRSFHHTDVFHIDCQRKYVVGMGVIVRLTLTDFSKIKRAEAEMLDRLAQQE